MMRQQTRKNILVLPDRVMRRIDLIRGSAGRDEFLRKCIGPGLKRHMPATHKKIKSYATHDNLWDFQQSLVMLLSDWVYLLLPSLSRPPVLQVEAGYGIIITDMEVRSRVKLGNTVPVYVTVYNQESYRETTDITLTDVSENIIIGRRALNLSPGASRTVQFIWKTRGFGPGDHILDVSLGEPDSF